METVGKPIVYISYTWRTPDLKRQVLALAEKLRAAGIDSRIDLYYAQSLHGFLPPDARLNDNRDAWTVWQEDQIRDADRVLLVCSREYAESPRSSGAWWDMRFMKDELDAGSVAPSKFIPVGFGPYAFNSQYIPPFLKGATYYNLDSYANEGFGFEDLLRRFRTEFPTQRTGIFISYSHKDKKWLDLLLEQLVFLRQRGVEIWTDKDILPGQLWNEEIKRALAKAKVAALLVTPAFLASPYITNHELPTLLRAAESEGLVIFWIPVKASSYQQSEIGQFQAAHPPSELLAGLTAAKRDEAFVSIASKLADVLGVGNPSAP